MDEEQSTFDDAEKAALSLAWDYFVYHAQQRQTVFNFFIILIGASLAAFAATIDKPAATRLHFVIGSVLAIGSFLFWRLDERSRNLIKLAEAALKEIELRLTTRTKLAWLTILARSDNKVGGGFSKVETFTQIYRLAFALAGCTGFVIIARAIL